MPKPLSNDLRERIVERWKRGGISVELLADVFMVSEASVRRLLHLHGATGSVEPRPHGGGRDPGLDEAGHAWLRQYVEQHQDGTTYEFTDAYNAWRGTRLHRSIILRALHALGFTRKKSRYLPPNAKANASRRGARNTSAPSQKSSARVWFLWTKPAPTSH